ncbi:uncharacterized protein N7479_006051 [Penicillium vulpinum]|uniref:Uncharacterized protein n=1 Tax=Penicillium vulpinum TaxID=29845 RepID=A0A1V6SED3_9EURO|nr:uncharacterized protein N7479_006051 [Penicillium vulpinum]KAJ5958901.1 hypothetical protein N7479_006051 [Penicillium vulpinum]OQE12351.1 hypothetical protein PENVUL_c001G09500 [Penicillium vulpinum]
MPYELPTTPKERITAARGYKAALQNDRVSVEAKDHAREMLLKLNEEEARQELGEESGHVPYHRHQQRSYENERPSSPEGIIGAARGYKAAIHNPLVSEEGKEHAWNMLEQMDDEEARQELYHQDDRPKDPVRVEAGLKAAQKNPLVSEDGHRRATEQLRDMEG